MTDNINEFEKRLITAAQDMVRYAKGDLTEENNIKVHSYPKVPEEAD
jgi:hypothetical protein